MLTYGNTDGLGRVIADCAYTGVHTVDKIGTVLSTCADNKLLLSYTTGIHAGVRRLFSAEAGTTDTRTVLSTDADAGAHVVVAVARGADVRPALILACVVRGGEISELPVALASSEDTLSPVTCLKRCSSSILSFSECNFSISACFVATEFSAAQAPVFFLIPLVCWIPSAKILFLLIFFFQIQHEVLSGTLSMSFHGGHPPQVVLFVSNYWPQPEFYVAIKLRFQ